MRQTYSFNIVFIWA